MSTIVIDAVLRERFLAAGGVVEVRDESGELVGKFYRSGPPIASDEMHRRRRKEFYTAGEVEAFLMGMRRALS